MARHLISLLPRTRRQQGKKVMSNADPRGKFVWHELLSGDAAAATAFYTKVVPWRSQPWEQDSSYSMWVAKNGPVGGIAKLDSPASPHWLAYVAVPDIGATVEAAKGLGGRVLKDKTSLPNSGSYAVLADPQGAEFAIYQAGAESGGNGAAGPGAGDFSWHELATTDAKAAMEFYTKLLGWEVGPVHDMGAPAGNYHLFLHQGNQYGGMFVSDGSGMGPSWLCYISVEDVGKATTAAKNAGGRVMNGPMEVPGGSWVAQVLDAEGAPFAVHEPAKTAQAAKPEKAAKAPKPKAAAPAAAPAAAKPAEAKPAAKPATAPAAAAPAAAKPAAAKPAAVKPAAAKPAAKPAAAKPAAKAPAKAAAKKGKKAAAKKAPAKKAASKKATKKAAAKGKAKVAAKKGKKVAKKAAPAKKKSRAKAKKHR
jgi:predicted enzyme related to lactoylglutathione lyase